MLLSMLLYTLFCALFRAESRPQMSIIGFFLGQLWAKCASLFAPLSTLSSSLAQTDGRKVDARQLCSSFWPPQIHWACPLLPLGFFWASFGRPLVSIGDHWKQLSRPGHCRGLGASHQSLGVGRARSVRRYFPALD